MPLEITYVKRKISNDCKIAVSFVALLMLVCLSLSIGTKYKACSVPIEQYPSLEVKS